LANFGGGEPVMEVGRAGILLVGKKLLKCLLLLGRAGKDQGELIEGQVRWNLADAISCAGPEGMVIGQRLDLRGVDRLGDAVGGRELRQGAGEGGGREQNGCEGEPNSSASGGGTRAH